MEIIHVPLNIKSPIRRLAAKNRKLRDIFSLQLTDAGELFWCLVKPSKASSHLVYNMCEQQTAPSEIPSDHISTSTARLCVVAKRRKNKTKKKRNHFISLYFVLYFVFLVLKRYDAGERLIMKCHDIQKEKKQVCRSRLRENISITTHYC